MLTPSMASANDTDLRAQGNFRAPSNSSSGVLRVKAARAVADALPNPAVDPVRFALWTLRDEAAQRRSP